jgi:hypothetical protein
VIVEPAIDGQEGLPHIRVGGENRALDEDAAGCALVPGHVSSRQAGLTLIDRDQRHPGGNGMRRR